MTCTRRELLRLAAATLAAGELVSERLWAHGQAPAPPPPVFTELRRNVGIFTGRGGTIGWVINPGGLLIVDTQYPDSARNCLDGLKTRAPGRSIDLIINTHYHRDHTGGNGVFRDSTKQIVAHARVPELQKADYARQQAGQSTLPPMPAPTFPDKTFAETFNAEIGDERIRARHHGPAHTGGDVLVALERANIVHMGDLMFNRLHPFVDREAGASAINWIAALERVVAQYDNDTLFIFGHAGAKWPVTGGKAELLVQRDYLTALVDFTRAKIKEGTPREVFIKITEPLPKFPDHGPLLERALAGTFDELTATMTKQGA